MLVAGVDIGSLSTDVVLLEDGAVRYSLVMATGANSRKAGERAMEKCLLELNITWDDLDYVVATGYGRISVPFANEQITEISCHGKGAQYLLPSTRTVIDIGGQDSKVIRVDARGKVTDFAMNEKCAAGTGRFLEVMARALEVELEEMGHLSRQARTAASISSMCTVFAESEVVSLIAQEVPVEEIIRGIHEAIANRTVTMARRVGVVETVTMTGGVAKNQGVVDSIGHKLGVKIDVPEDPQVVGAFGAALVAAERSAARQK